MACALAAGVMIMLFIKCASIEMSVAEQITGAILGMIVVGLAAGLVRWGFQGMLATLTACTWFASPALAFGLSALMYFVMEDTEVNRPLQWALSLLPWLVGGLVVIILAQLFKADFEKGWAAWLQAMVTTTIGLGAVWVTWDYMTDEDEDKPAQGSNAQNNKVTSSG
ncbi:g5265 [Coccomyxa viridis]|uniref:G5265 protein n=1 Tax=Coccomyxa viridis TaxID=1274662 RepID=A0ABP1FWC6_9CHLO